MSSAIWIFVLAVLREPLAAPLQVLQRLAAPRPPPAANAASFLNRPWKIAGETGAILASQLLCDPASVISSLHAWRVPRPWRGGGSHHMKVCVVAADSSVFLCFL